MGKTISFVLGEHFQNSSINKYTQDAIALLVKL